MNQRELYHHGIKGMRWGVRRYENEDGTLTEAGKKRYRNYSDDAIRRDQLLRKDKNSLTTKEMNELNNRLQAEENYSRLINNTQSSGKKIASKYMKQFGAAILGAAVATASVYVINKYVKPEVTDFMEKIDVGRIKAIDLFKDGISVSNQMKNPSMPTYSYDNANRVDIGEFDKNVNISTPGFKANVNGLNVNISNDYDKKVDNHVNNKKDNSLKKAKIERQINALKQIRAEMAKSKSYTIDDFAETLSELKELQNKLEKLS